MRRDGGGAGAGSGAGSGAGAGADGGADFSGCLRCGLAGVRVSSPPRRISARMSWIPILERRSSSLRICRAHRRHQSPSSLHDGPIARQSCPREFGSIQQLIGVRQRGRSARRRRNRGEHTRCGARHLSIDVADRGGATLLSCGGTWGEGAPVQQLHNYLLFILLYGYFTVCLFVLYFIYHLFVSSFNDSYFTAVGELLSISICCLYLLCAAL